MSAPDQAGVERAFLGLGTNLGDRVMGVVAGFLVWSGRLETGPQAVALVEAVVGHQMGSTGRQLVVAVDGMPPHTSE